MALGLKAAMGMISTQLLLCDPLHPAVLPQLDETDWIDAIPC